MSTWGHFLPLVTSLGTKDALSRSGTLDELVGSGREVGEDRVFGLRLTAVTLRSMAGRTESLEDLLGACRLLRELRNMIEFDKLQWRCAHGAE